MSKRGYLIVGLAVSGLLFHTVTTARTNCDFSGNVDRPIDPGLAPKIIDWAKKAEAKAGLDHMVYRFPLRKPAPPAQAAMLNLQAVAADWAMEVGRGTVEGIYRQAVLHGIGAQYQTLMIHEDPENAATHEMWRDTEAARANACLTLIQPQ